MKKIYGIIFTLLLSAFTLYILLDTFVMTKSYAIVPEHTEEEHEKEPDEVVFTDDYYKDENIEIQIIKDRAYETDYYIADVKIQDIRYLKTAFAKNTYGKNITEYTSVTAKDNKAILAINGDYYGVQEKGYVLKNSKIYRKSKKSNQEDLVINQDGTFSIINENDTNIENLNNAKELLSFGPALIQNKKVIVNEKSTVAKELASNPRTAIALIEPYHYIFFVSDGRTDESKGLSLYEVAKVLEKYDVGLAYNLDGGGSSSFYFNGKIVNKPRNKGKDGERKVSDIVYIGY